MHALLKKAVPASIIIAFSSVLLTSSAHSAERMEPDMASGHIDAFLKTLMVKWWQCAVSIPVFESPLLDQTGKSAWSDNAASYGSWPATSGWRYDPQLRRIRAKAALLPVTNSVNIDTPNVCGQGPERIPVAQLRSLSAA
jgi:hypothetical protein